MLSLADELGEVFSPDRRKSFVSGLRDSECRSPDSGISLVHSPERAKSSSPQEIGNEPTTITLIHIITLSTYLNETLIYAQTLRLQRLRVHRVFHYLN